MLNIQTWDPTATWDPTNPNQQPDQYWSAADMGYRSAYWNEQPTTAQSLAGALPDSTGARVGLALAAAAGLFFGYRAFKGKRPIFGFAGIEKPARRSRRRRR